MSKFIFSLGLMFFALTLGYLIRILIDKGILHLPFELILIRKVLQKITLLFFIPAAFLGAVWIVNLDNLKNEMDKILFDISYREKMHENFRLLKEKLGGAEASKNTAKFIFEHLKNNVKN